MVLPLSIEDLRIIEFLQRHPNEMFYATELARQLGFPKSTFLYRVEKLVRDGYVKEVPKGRMKFYQYSFHETARLIGNLGRLVVRQHDILMRLQELRRSPQKASPDEIDSILQNIKSIDESIEQLVALLDDINIRVQNTPEGERAKLVDDLLKNLNETFEMRTK